MLSASAPRLCTPEIAKAYGWWLIPLVIAGCYSPNQADLRRTVVKLIAVGMSMPTVESRMTSAGFACSGSSPMACVRVRHNPLGPACVERVTVEQDLGTLE